MRLRARPLSASVWRWHRDGTEWTVDEVITIPAEPLAGGPQMVEVSRDGKRIFVTNSLYGAWDDQFYPAGVGAWLAKIDTDPASGGLTLDERFFPRGEQFHGRRVHQVRLQGGDASSDSYCYR